MKTEIESSLASEIETFRTAFANGMKMIETAARQYAKSLADHPGVADIAYAEKFPTLSQKDWKLLSKIGRGDLVPRAFLIPNDYAVRCIEVLPIHVQQALVGTEDSKPVPQKVFSRGRIVEKTIDSMNAVELNSLIDMKAGQLRAPSVQLEIAAARPVVKDESTAWRVVNGMLCVYGRVNFSVVEVADILRKMKGAK